MKANIPPEMFPITIPHQTPVNLNPRATEKIKAKGAAKIMVRKIVVISELIPLPVP